MKPIWTYAYRIVPPQSEQSLRSIKLLLDAEHRCSESAHGSFEARLLVERQVTDILVVTDSPDQAREVNQRLAAELDRLQVAFKLTAPLAVPDENGPKSPPPRSPL